MTWHQLSTARSVTLLAALIALPLIACGGGDETVEINGTTGDCLNVDGTWTGDPIGGAPGSLERGFTQTCSDVQMSDERASGVLEALVDCELTQEGEATTGVCSGTVTISNDGGTWQGTVEGTTSWTTSEPVHVHALDSTFLGTGGYDGLRMVFHAAGYSTPWTLTGRIEPVD